jgi:hypothetical protein
VRPLEAHGQAVGTGWLGPATATAPHTSHSSGPAPAPDLHTRQAADRAVAGDERHPLTATPEHDPDLLATRSEQLIIADNGYVSPNSTRGWLA